MRPTLLSYLATRPGEDAEALAATTLAFLTAQSPAVEGAIFEVCAIAAPDIGDLAGRLVFRVGEPGADNAASLTGIDRDGVPRLLVETRFWSALPASRPLRWVRDVSGERPGAVLVLAPAQRFTPLWAEIRRRLRASGARNHSDHAVGTPIRWVRFGDKVTVILANWSALLASARTRLLADGDQQALGELDQLAALCARMESDEFAPLTVDDVGSLAARKLRQLHGMVDDLAQACEAHGLGAVVPGPPPARPGHYERRLRLGTTMLALCLSVDRWATLRETPFWLLIYDTEGRPARGVDARLDALSSEAPPRLLRDAETGCPLVPLFALTGFGRGAVLGDLVGQVTEVARLLGEGPTSGFGSSA